MSNAARMHARAALAAMLALGVLLSCERAFACSCVDRTPAEAYAQAVAVFEGHVLEIIEPAPGAEGVAAVLKVRLAVVRSWKGMEQEQVEVTTPTNSAKCGFTFAADQNYLIYAASNASGLSVSLCSRTRPIEQADEDVHEIGLGATPVDPRAPESEKVVNSASAQPRPATKGGCASCSIGHAEHRALPIGAVLTLALAFSLRMRRQRS
jgi:hypothetical protein